MPPPPVSGAAAGNAWDLRLRLADGWGRARRVADGCERALRVADGWERALRVADGWERALRVADGWERALRVSDGWERALRVVVPAGLGELLAGPEEVAPGDKLGSVVCGDDVQPATAADASKATKPAVISRTLNPVIAKCLL